jgi:ribonuclease D
MMLRDRWAAASSYALSFVNYRDCSREADELNYRILTAFAAGQARSVETLFRRMYAYLRFKPDRDRIAIRRLLLAMRSDDTKYWLPSTANMHQLLKL